MPSASISARFISFHPRKNETNSPCQTSRLDNRSQHLLLHRQTCQLPPLN